MIFYRIYIFFFTKVIHISFYFLTQSFFTRDNTT